MKKALAHLKKTDAILASIIERVGPYNISYRDPTFEALARSIVFQQLSTKAVLYLNSAMTSLTERSYPI